MINESCEQLLHIAKAIAKENYNETYSAPHLLQALMHREMGLRDLLLSLEKDPGYIYDWADVRIEELPKTTQLPETIIQHASLEHLQAAAEDVRLKLGMDEVTPLCMLAATVKPNIVFSTEQLKSLPLRDFEIYKVFENRDNNNTVLQQSALVNDWNNAGNEDAFAILKKYCVDKTAFAKSGNIDAIIGREQETRNLIEVLCRYSKPNVVIVGEPGVGKTAMVEGLAHEIIKDNVPLVLKNALLLELDCGSLFAGASYKGEVEDRLKKIIIACKRLDKAILFIDEIHTLLDSKGGTSNGVVNLLKPELDRGAITVIGATTQEEYRKIFEREQAFNRRFEVLNIEEPDNATCIKMIAAIIDKYKKHHSIEITADALPECVRLSRRYAKGKKLPDAAIDLLDRTMAAVKMLNELSDTELKNWKADYDAVLQNKSLSDEDYVTELDWIYAQLQYRISPILWGSLKEQPVLDSTMTVIQKRTSIDQTFHELQQLATIKREKVGKLELAAVMAAKTGIPIGKIQAQEKEKLLNMESYLLKRVIGQDHALKILSDAILENRSGLNKPGQPIGSFFLLGPTGTGKTELAKSMAELLFNDEKAMIRFDMSEFKEEHSAALLYGAPPGYVGYEEGGMLVNKIRQQPYAVVLFDEIEKAHQSVFDVFLQIMDEGKIHDKLGKEGDFSNALVLFTSNIGSNEIVAKFEHHEIPSSSDLMQIMSGQFRPEFLARITEIIPFAPITASMAERIFSIQLQTLYNAVSRLGFEFKISDEAIRNLAITGFSSKYGARQIAGVIRTQLTRPISKLIVKEEVKSGQTIQVNWDDNNKGIKWAIH